MTDLRGLPASFLYLLRDLSRRLSVRVALMGALAIVTLGLTQWVEPFVPRAMTSVVGGAAADRLLNLIANAMLAVTTFSLTVMVSVYRSSSTQWTPRVHQLIMQDAVTQNTLAAFIGAYFYALVAIIMREVGLYDDQSAAVLFWVTVLVLAFVVWSLVRWTLHLQTLGSLIDTTRQVEQIASLQFKDRLGTPCLGACPWDGDLPDGATPIPARDSGYIQLVEAKALEKLAKAQDVQIYLAPLLGSFVFANEPLAYVSGTPHDKDALADGVCRLIQLGDVRTYDQDPRFGLLVMSEIGSKALSPGINDPGTAIDVVNRAARILSLYRDETKGEGPPQCPNLHVRPLDPGDLIEDAFGAIARDGADVIEVQVRLQRALGALAQHADPGLAQKARDMAQTCLQRAQDAMDWAPDRDRVAASAPGDIASR